MSSRLLSTKLYIPRVRSNLILRPRLDEKLQTGDLRPLTLVCAPAGFGKSTLVADWDRQRELPNETPPGVLARFKFRVVDGRFGEPPAEEGAFSIEITRAVTDDATDVASQSDEFFQLERSRIEAVLRGAVVVRVENP